MLPDSRGFGAPIIGDNVYIGAGAKIIGNVRVGNNVRIGANAVIHRDISDKSVVTSGEQTILARNKPLYNRLYDYNKGWVVFDNGNWKPVSDAKVLDILEEYRRSWTF